MITADATPKPEPRDMRMLVFVGSSVRAQTPAGTRSVLLEGASDAAYSPDGTLVAFTRQRDLWLANADGSGERRLAPTPEVAEGKPSWLPSGSSVCVVPSSTTITRVASSWSALYASFVPSGDHASSWMSVNGVAGGVVSNGVAPNPFAWAT